MIEKRNEEESIVYSDDLMNLLGRTPSWILKWGNAMFLLFLLGFVVLSFIVRYPEVIKSRIIITTPLPPASIVALTSGQIDSLCVKDHCHVRNGELLAILKSAIKYEDVIIVKNLLARDTIPSDIHQTYRLGDIQFDYNNYLLAYKEYAQFNKLNPYQNKISKLQENQFFYLRLLDQLNRQLSISRNEMDIIGNHYAVDSTLHSKENTISKRELEVSKLNFLSRKTDLESNKQSLLRTQLQYQELTNHISELKVSFANEHDQLQNALISAKKQLESRINIWESNHILIAPIEGTVSFFNYWTKNQFVKGGEEVFTIIPNGDQHIIGKIIMPTFNSGKVGIGQKVMVRLDGYPFKEYGLIKGTITNISLVPKNQSYAAEVSFQNGLLTTYKKKLKLNQEMAGDAEIITEDLRLIHRILYQFKDLLYNKTAD